MMSKPSRADLPWMSVISTPQGDAVEFHECEEHALAEVAANARSPRDTAYVANIHWQMERRGPIDATRTILVPFTVTPERTRALKEAGYRGIHHVGGVKTVLERLLAAAVDREAKPS